MSFACTPPKPTGPRICLGKEIALMELYKTPLQFLRSFTPEMVDKQAPGTYVIKGGVSFFEKTYMRIERRAQVVVV